MLCRMFRLFADINVVSAEHKLNDIGLSILYLAHDDIPSNIIRLLARVAFVVRIKTRRPRALGLEVIYTTDETDTTG